MCRKLAHLVSFVLVFALFGSICRGLENHNTLQEEGVIDTNLAYEPHPPDGAIHHDLWVNLQWSPGRYAATHDVYCGDNFEDVNNGTWETFRGNQLYTFFVIGFPSFAYPDILKPSTTYYWRIDEINDLHPDSPWKGNVWSFCITPLTACDPYPPDHARLIDPNITLTRTVDYRTEFHIVYFGDNFDNVNNATGDLPQRTTTYTPDPLERGKTYYWRVDESNFWTTCKGDVWSFATEIEYQHGLKSILLKEESNPGGFK